MAHPPRLSAHELAPTEPKKPTSARAKKMKKVIASIRNFTCAYSAAKLSLPLALTGSVLKAFILYSDSWGPAVEWCLPSDNVYKIIASLISFLVIFQTSHAYSRFMSGVTMVYQIYADFLDTAALLVSFSNASLASFEAKDNFQHLVIRLFSLLFCCCLGDLEGREDEHLVANSFTLLDPEGLDTQTLEAVRRSRSKAVAMNQRIMDLINSASRKSGGLILDVPPALLARCTQEQGNGMFKYHEALKFKEVPIPLPYWILAEVLLLIFSLMTPFAMCTWATSVIGTGWFTFAICFFLWTLHSLADELDNPFSNNGRDFEGELMMDHFNSDLLSLLDTSRLLPPFLSDPDNKTIGNACNSDKTIVPSSNWRETMSTDVGNWPETRSNDVERPTQKQSVVLDVMQDLGYTTSVIQKDGIPEVDTDLPSTKVRQKKDPQKTDADLHASGADPCGDLREPRGTKCTEANRPLVLAPGANDLPEGQVKAVSPFGRTYDWTAAFHRSQPEKSTRADGVTGDPICFL